MFHPQGHGLVHMKLTSGSRQPLLSGKVGRGLDLCMTLLYLSVILEHECVGQITYKSSPERSEAAPWSWGRVGGSEQMGGPPQLATRCLR